ncbi:GmrSD restriction endonuclease domain-containing protein [Ruminococcus sp.]
MILDDKKASETKTPAQKRLLYAKAFFEDKIKCCSDEQIEELLDRVCSTNVLIYLIQDSIEAAMIFETTNDRGKSLTNLEKTKSFLMYKASLCLDEPEQILGKIQSRFSEVYRDFESMISLNIGVDENSVLQYNYIAYEKWKTDSSIKEYTRYMEYFKNTVEELARNSNGAKEDKPLLSDYIENYTYNVQQSFSAYKSMYEGRYLEFMDIIALDRTASFMPLLIKCYRYDETNDKSKFRIICRLCEIFSFRVYVIFDKMANKLQSKWYSLARDFDSNFKNASDEIIAMINDVESDDAFIQALTAPDFCTKYSSPEKNYFYWKYENYLRRTEQPVATPMTHEDLRQKENKKLVMTIEHIVAQSNSGEKSKVITDALKIDVGSVEVFDEQYLNSIGNLTLDPQSANSSKGKKDVVEKNSKHFAKAPYKCQNELEEFMIDDVWTLESIKKRKAKLLTFAKELWCNFDFVKVLRV